MNPYQLDPARTATVHYTAREWTRYLLRITETDETEALPSNHLITYVLTMLPVSDHYPDDRIAVSATTREASLIVAQMRHHAQGVR
jgi:PIN domain nuclease of toxin-antitoxin system